MTALGAAHQLHLNTVRTRYGKKSLANNGKKSLANNVLPRGTAKGRHRQLRICDSPSTDTTAPQNPNTNLWRKFRGRLNSGQVWKMEILRTHRWFLCKREGGEGKGRFQKGWRLDLLMMQRSRKKQGIYAKNCLRSETQFISYNSGTGREITQPHVFVQDFCPAMPKSHSTPRWNQRMES